MYVCMCVYVYIYIFTSFTTIIKYKIVSANKLKIRSYMFQPHCSHLQTNLHRSSTFNVRTIWDPIVCRAMIYV